MPYASKKQQRFFHAAEERGDIKPSVVHEYDEASKGMKLPEAAKGSGSHHGTEAAFHRGKGKK